MLGLQKARRKDDAFMKEIIMKLYSVLKIVNLISKLTTFILLYTLITIYAHTIMLYFGEFVPMSIIYFIVQVLNFNYPF